MMKRHLHNSLRALFLSLAVLLSLPMMAVEVMIDGINYELYANVKYATVIKKSYGMYSGKIVIPESVEYGGTTYSVESIGREAFCACSGLTSVTIPNSVTSIGREAFYNCKGLTSVTIPNSVTSIGDEAFCNCYGLTSVTIGNSVTSIGDSAFRDCSRLTSVHISDIAAWCNIDFGYYYFSNPLYYAHHLYMNGEEIKDLVIPNSVTSIGDYAFQSCSGLTSVTIPNSVTSIGGSAFEDCSGLTSVTIPNSVTSIGNSAFWGCSGLTSVTIPNSVTSIGNSAFSRCSGLTSVHISDIAAWCNIYFGNSFSNPLYYAHHLYMNGEEVKDLVIPNSVTSIGDKAFQYYSGLTSVTIPNSVTSIGWWAFYGCKELLDVYCLAEKVPSADSEAFDGSYPEYATLHVPAVSIDNYKATSPWSLFGKIVALSGEEPGLPEVAVEIDGINYEFVANVKQTTVIAKSSGMYSGEIVIPESVEHEGTAYSVTSIGDEAFRNCSGLTSVTIGNSVTSIGDWAFYGCSGLTSVTIGNSVTSIGGYAFGFCSGLTSVTIPNSVTSIGNDAFYYCSGLTSVTIPNSVTSIGDWAFYYCSGLTSVTIPNSVTSIGFAAFEGCSGLTSVTIPNSVTSIGIRAFEGCSGLTSVTIPNSVTSIGNYAFAYCPELLDVYCLAEKVPSTYSEAFYKSYPEYATLHVPDASVDSYKATSPWSKFGKIVALTGEDENEETGVISVEAAPVLVQGNGGILSVSGVAKDTEVVVYTISGTEVARATATDGTATISTGLQRGTIVVVKFGNKSVKVRI